jgi:hypothetical protein
MRNHRLFCLLQPLNINEYLSSTNKTSIFMKGKIVTILLLVITLSTKAQWVEIPDSNFVKSLSEHGLATCLNGNLLDTTCIDLQTIISFDCHYTGELATDITGIRF